MEAIAANLQKAWILYDYEMLASFLTEEVEYISLSLPIFLGGKNKVIAHLQKSFINLKKINAVTELIPGDKPLECFEVIHRYTQFVPELNYMISNSEIYNVIVLEPREVEIRVEIYFEIVDAKIDLILVDQKNKTRKRV